MIIQDPAANPKLHAVHISLFGMKYGVTPINACYARTGECHGYRKRTPLQVFDVSFWMHKVMGMCEEKIRD
jgi:hypothetical protein